jgi:hypothetical protein
MTPSSPTPITIPSLSDLINDWQIEKKLNLDVVQYSDTQGLTYGMLNDKMGWQFGNIFSDFIACQRDKWVWVEIYNDWQYQGVEKFTLHAADPEFFEKLRAHIDIVRMRE